MKGNVGYDLQFIKWIVKLCIIYPNISSNNCTVSSSSSTIAIEGLTLRYHLQDIDWQYVIYRLIALYEKIEKMLFISKKVTYYTKIVRIMMQKICK
jgi:hypothetical protein